MVFSMSLSAQDMKQQQNYKKPPLLRGFGVPQIRERWQSIYLYERIQKKEIVIFDLLEMVNID
jgi:hypothetical protein